MTETPPRRNAKPGRTLINLAAFILLLLTVLSIAVAGIALFLFGGRVLLEGTLLLVAGDSTEGLVTNLVFVRGDADSGDNYYVDYQFRANGPNNEPTLFYDQSTISQDRYNALRIEGPVTVHYVRFNPTISTAAVFTWELTRMAVGGVFGVSVGALLTAIGVRLTLGALDDAFGHLRLFRRRRPPPSP